MNKCFSDYELTCRVENALRNTSESNPGDLWKILSKFKRSKREDKIDVDELYEYFKVNIVYLIILNFSDITLLFEQWIIFKNLQFILLFLNI
jgi:hypothetical protein